MENLYLFDSPELEGTMGEVAAGALGTGFIYLRGLVLACQFWHIVVLYFKFGMWFISNLYLTMGPIS